MHRHLSQHFRRGYAALALDAPIAQFGDFDNNDGCVLAALVVSDD
jgi:hypothetical protein